MSGALAVLGPGGVGGFLAGVLAHAGEEVVLVARPSSASHIAANGLHVESVLLGTFSASPRVVTSLDEPVDVLFVAAKAPGLPAALERVSSTPQLVVPLLNGLDHVAALRERFGSRAVAATIRIESDRPAPGRIVHTSRFLLVELASDDPGPVPALQALAARLSAAGIPARVRESEAAALWGKLVRLNALACTTSAYDLPLGDIRSDPERRAVLERCVRETAAVAQAEGAPLEADETMAELDAAHASLGSSMQRDIAAGREPELDAIPGAVLRAAERHGLPCPTVAALVARIEERLA